MCRDGDGGGAPGRRASAVFARAQDEDRNMPDRTLQPNKYRAAINVLQRGRDVLIDALAEEIIGQGPDLIDGGYQFNEFLESQGTRLHFLSLLLAQLEQSAEALDESLAAAPPPPPKRRALKKARTRTKKVGEKVASEGTPDDT
jgi:hypothetical protein